MDTTTWHKTVKVVGRETIHQTLFVAFRSLLGIVGVKTKANSGASFGWGKGLKL